MALLSLPFWEFFQAANSCPCLTLVIQHRRSRPAFSAAVAPTRSALRLGRPQEPPPPNPRSCATAPSRPRAASTPEYVGRPSAAPEHQKQTDPLPPCVHPTVIGG